MTADFFVKFITIDIYTRAYTWLLYGDNTFNNDKKAPNSHGLFPLSQSSTLQPSSASSISTTQSKLNHHQHHQYQQHNQQSLRDYKG